ncbi:MAG: HAMP domain-containing histidine kinase [Deltaproteobacteria bacterium]|nr:HAMP domain-containing histidine kinase [Deltaproteobacteria bacterium]
MSNFFQILKQLSEEDNERLLKVARFAELGISASAVIHEIRQPMTALSMTLQMILDGLHTKSDEVEKNVNEALNLVGRTEQLISRARDFMSPSTEVGEVDLVESITKVLSAFQWQLLNRPSIQLKAHVPEHLPHILADRTQIEQMLANLVSNSMDAVDDVSDAVVLVAVYARDNNFVEFIVADNGCGMSQEVKEKAFEPFFSTKGDRQGTGLGLFIVMQIISRYDGQIRIMREDELAQLEAQNLKTGISIMIPTGVAV